MIPNSRLKTLEHHKYQVNDISLLKVASIYGANGSGKSNIIKSLELFQRLVRNEDIPLYLRESKFKLSTDNSIQVLAVEYIIEEVPFYYAVETHDNIILTEELYISGLGKTKDSLIFERKTDLNSKTRIRFSEEIDNDEKIKVIKTVLIEEFVKPKELVLKLISNRDNEKLAITKKAYKWFDEMLQIIRPESKPLALAKKIETDKIFQSFAENIMCSFNVGISELTSEKREFTKYSEDSINLDYESLIKQVDSSPKELIILKNRRGNEILISKEDNKYWVRRLKIGHKNKDNNQVFFNLEEESDGTIRLLDFVPALQDVSTKQKVIVIDEIERSIHPLLIKEILSKFSKDIKSCGQIIFTTHESNLLDQEIFRQDEIWFSEKDKFGNSDLYSLSDFKEHKTIDIRKGYLNGRYGSIPFLANLKDLNWHNHDNNE